MNTVFVILAVLVVIASILLTIVVLLQNGKGGGLASNFVAGNQTFGVRQTADLLEKITWGLVAVIFLLSVISVYTIPTKDSTDATDQVEKIAPEGEALPTLPVNDQDK